MLGKVRSFDANKGYGFINAEGDDKDVFFHYSSINMEGYKILNPGDTVEFELINSERGPQAKNIEKK